MKPRSTKALGEVAEFINGCPFKPSEWSTKGVPIIRIQNLTDPEAPANYFDGTVDERYAVRNGDLLVSWSATLDVFVWERGNAVLNQHIFRVIPDQSMVSKPYLFYALKSVMDELRSKTHGATMKHITKEPFEKTAIPVPSLREQEQIVALLNEADTLRKLRAQADQRSAALIPALFHEILGNPDSAHWQERKLGDAEVLEIIDGDRGTNYPKKTDFGESGYCLFLNTSNVRKGAFDFSKCDFITSEKDSALRKGKLTRGDVVLTTRGTLGNSAHYDNNVPYGNVRINSGMVILRANPTLLLPEYLLTFLNSNGFTTQVATLTSGSAQPQLPINRLSHVTFVSPPLPLQRELVRRVAEIREMEGVQAASGKRLEDLFQSLLHDAFSGEYDEATHSGAAA